MTVKMVSKKAAGKPTFIQKVIKEDTYMVLAASQYYPEDEFVGLYYSQTDTSKIFLQPPYEPKKLQYLVTQNNILAQCVEAMEVNIDGTGYELVGVKDDEDPEPGEQERIKGFFDQPYPNKSIITLRREMRRDLESIGWGAFEVLRAVDEKVVGMRHVSAHTLRYVRLDQPVFVTKTIVRNGVETTLSYWDRERRFAQKVGPNAFVYFREFGSSRHIDRITGDWETKEKPIPPERRGSELIVFRVHPDVDTPYGVPRWINNLPSVVGSRKAEEQNLEFFDAGGLPPAIIFIQGGTLAKDMADSLRMYLTGQQKSRHRAVVVEAQPSSGSIESVGKVEVKVERFGAESTKDSMFQQYDTRSEEHVRVAFRLPPMFLGKAQDYNFATAQTGYMVAEAQVFQPERYSFDEIINATIMRALGAVTCKFKSKPITLKDSQLILNSIDKVADKVEPDGIVEEVNKLAGTAFTFKEPPKPVIGIDADGNPIEGEHGQTPPPAPPFGGKPGEEKGGNVIPFGKKKNEAAAEEDPEEKEVVEKADKGTVQQTLRLALDFCRAEGLIPSKFEFSGSEKEMIRKSVDALPSNERELLNRFVGIHVKASLDAGEVAPCCQ